jgi:hypothetical protein
MLPHLPPGCCAFLIEGKKTGEDFVVRQVGVNVAVKDINRFAVQSIASKQRLL